MAALSALQLEGLWIRAGGNPAAAPTAAAIALAESGGRSDALNNNPATGDYSVGPWQINYFGPLLQSRSRQFGSPDQLRADPLANARAAVAISGNGRNFSPWTTYTSGAYRAYSGRTVPVLGSRPTYTTPGSPGYTSPQAEAGRGVKAVSDLTGAGSILDFVKRLADPNLWLRIGQVVGGAILAFAGIVLLVKQIGLSPPSVPNPVTRVAEAAV